MNILSYKIAGINVIKFSCEKDFNLEKPVNISTGFQFKLNKQDKLIACIGEYKYSQDETPVMALTLECIYMIESSSFDSLRQEDKYVVSADILQYLATISVGTARGEIHARTEASGSALRTVVLPPINLTKIITNDSLFDA